MEFYLCRHGETEANAARLMSGWVDTPLTDKGVEDASKIAFRLFKGLVSFDRVYCSDLGRSFRTASIISWNCGDTRPPCPRKELREMHYGDFDYKPREDIVTKCDFFNTDFIFPNGESFRTFQKRIIDYVTTLTTSMSVQTRILLVTHSGVIRAINDHFGQYDINQGRYRKVGHDYLGRYLIDENNKLLLYQEV